MSYELLSHQERLPPDYMSLSQCSSQLEKSHLPMHIERPSNNDVMDFHADSMYGSIYPAREDTTEFTEIVDALTSDGNLDLITSQLSSIEVQSPRHSSSSLRRTFTYGNSTPITPRTRELDKVHRFTSEPRFGKSTPKYSHGNQRVNLDHRPLRGNQPAILDRMKDSCRSDHLYPSTSDCDETFSVVSVCGETEEAFSRYEVESRAEENLLNNNSILVRSNFAPIKERNTPNPSIPLRSTSSYFGSYEQPSNDNFSFDICPPSTNSVDLVHEGSTSSKTHYEQPSNDSFRFDICPPSTNSVASVLEGSTSSKTDYLETFIENLRGDDFYDSELNLKSESSSVESGRTDKTIHDADIAKVLNEQQELLDSSSVHSSYDRPVGFCKESLKQFKYSLQGKMRHNLSLRKKTRNEVMSLPDLSYSKSRDDKQNVSERKLRTESLSLKREAKLQKYIKSSYKDDSSDSDETEKSIYIRCMGCVRILQIDSHATIVCCPVCRVATPIIG